MLLRGDGLMARREEQAVVALAVVCMSGWQRAVWESGRELCGRVAVGCMGEWQ